ncbi:MAG TPA: ThuA domain-containing protein, partial [Flavisolibacter sp.]|nr:ThuA domain-containing protein [Flavisolibacter sp.]
MKLVLITAIALFIAIISFSFAGKHYDANDPRRLEILFLGHQNKHHNSELLADIVTKDFFKQGINITYTTNPNDLKEDVLNGYDGLILYANYDSISKPQETALLNFVKNGKGFIPLHCASHCFRNSPDVVELIGG